MKTKKMLIVGLVIVMSSLLVLGLVTFIRAMPGAPWSCSFTTRSYSWTKGTALDGCGTCHTDFSGSFITPENLQLNPYGLDCQASKDQYLIGNSKSSSKSCEHNYIDAIGQWDSDGDGYNNLYEISALSFPGYTSLDCPPEANGECEPVPNPGDMDYDGVPSADDCNDYAATAYPGASEECDGIDNDCNGLIDEGFDSDGDGVTVCQFDCDDYDPTIYPGAPEVCDGLDNDCDGVVDEGCPCTDNDNDGYAVEGGSCGPVDCDDTDASINPGATEVCDGVDNNCDGQIDEGFDNDGDGYTTCGGDCDDSNAAVNPGAAEVCDGVDNNCDGFVDEGCPPICTDADGDGYYAEGGDCGPVDCDDTSPQVNPGVSESGKRKCRDGIDNDCDSLVDADDPDCAGGGKPARENCKNGADDDADGLIDCADPDCSGSKWCP